MKKIAALIPYYGSWPGSIQLFNESCKYNLLIDFYFITDLAPFSSPSKNIFFYHLPFSKLRERIEEIFNISIPNHEPYKLCDFRPAYGIIFNDIINGYDFWGHSDIDLVFGDLSAFLTTDILEKHDIICFRPDHLHGPFTLYKNSSFVNNLFKRAENYREIFQNPQYVTFDEFGNEEFHIKHEKPIEEYSNSAMSVIALKAAAKKEISLYLKLHSKEKIFLSNEILIYKNHKLFNYYTGEEYAFYHWVWEKRAIYFNPPSWTKVPERYLITSTGFYKRNFIIIIFVHYFFKTCGIIRWAWLKATNYIKRKFNLPVKTDTYSTPGLVQHLGKAIQYPDKKHILFQQIGTFSHINDAVINQIKKNFSEYDLEIIDIADIFNSLGFKRICTLFYLVMEYGLDFIMKRKSRYDYTTWERVTSYAFKMIKEEIQRKIICSNGKYVFSFQTQSMFDGSSGFIPHFVYTDSTVLALTLFPDINVKQIMRSRAWMKLEPSIYHNASMNFTFSSNQSWSLINQYDVNREKVKCIYAGSNLAYNDDLYKDKKYDNKNILFVGVNWKRKGGKTLLKAFHKVLKSAPQATLTIVGCTPNIRHKNVRIIGRIPLSEVEKYYKDASVFCMPTKIEPFGIVFTEAMMRKLPVVATNTGALPDMIQSNFNGFLHEWNDIDGIAQSLLTLINDPDKCRIFGERGHQIAIERYNWDKVGAEMTKHIKPFCIQELKLKIKKVKKHTNQ